MEDSVNGIPIKQWLDQQDALELNGVRDKHSFYRVPKKKYVVRGRCNKARRLTKREIIKEYGRDKVMSNVDKFLGMIINMWLSKVKYSSKDMRVFLPSMNPSSLSAILSTHSGALVTSGYLTEDNSEIPCKYAHGPKLIPGKTTVQELKQCLASFSVKSKPITKDRLSVKSKPFIKDRQVHNNNATLDININFIVSFGVSE